MLRPFVPSDPYSPAVVHHNESTLLRARRPHVLVVGPRASIAPTLAQLRPHLRGPLSHWRPAVASEPPLPATGALIIWDVERLDADQQRRLLTWMDGRGANVQIVSIAERPLFPLVWRKRFLDDLYYRLNMVCVTLTA